VVKVFNEQGIRGIVTIVVETYVRVLLLIARISGETNGKKGKDPLPLLLDSYYRSIQQQVPWRQKSIPFVRGWNERSIDDR